MSSTLVLKPNLGVDVSVTVNTTGGFLLEIDGRYLTGGAGGYESAMISKEDAVELIQFLHEALIQYNFSKEA